MSRLLIASSPVEIEARAEQAGLDPAAHDMALALFHDLTDRLGHAARAARAQGGDHATWPAHRFYFGPSTEPDLALLLSGLQDRPDFAEIDGPPPGQPSGLFARETRGGFTGVLVGHESHDGLLSPTEP